LKQAHISIQFITQGECERCQGKGETHGKECLVRKLIFDHDNPQIKQVNRKEVMETVIAAFEKAIERYKTTTL
jgi:hypothetical protein